MPELPEVETVRQQLWRGVRGKKIKKVTVLRPKSVRDDSGFARKLKGLQVKDIDRIGKLLIFSFKGKTNLFLLVHLKMTGQLFLVDPKGKRRAEGGHETPLDHVLPNSHTRVIIEFNDGTTLFFNDQRVFGYLTLSDREGMGLARDRFGPEPHGPDFDLNRFFLGLNRSSRSVKAILLDQTFVAGLGNIYVDESLWRAKIHPTRLGKSISESEARVLARQSAKVLKEAIKHGGTTFQSFKDSTGQKGNYTKFLKVFSRHGQPCPRCGTTIEKSRVAGRGTHFCPKCQQ